MRFASSHNENCWFWTTLTSVCDAFCLFDAKMWQMSRCIYDTPFTPWWPGFKRIFFVTPTVTHCRRCHSVSKKSHFATIWIFTPKIITESSSISSAKMKIMRHFWDDFQTLCKWSRRTLKKVFLPKSILDDLAAKNLEFTLTLELPIDGLFGTKDKCQIIGRLWDTKMNGISILCIENQNNWLITLF